MTGQGSSTATEALNSAIEAEAQRMREAYNVALRDNPGANFKRKIDCYAKMKAFAQFVQDFEKKLLPETSLEYVLGVLIGFFDREVKPFGAANYPYYRELEEWVERRRADGFGGYGHTPHLLRACLTHLPAP